MTVAPTKPEPKRTLANRLAVLEKLALAHDRRIADLADIAASQGNAIQHINAFAPDAPVSHESLSDESRWYERTNWWKVVALTLGGLYAASIAFILVTAP